MKLGIKIPKEFKKKLLTKRQKFAAGVIFLSISLFIVDRFLDRSGFVSVLVLAILTNVFLFWALYND